MAPPHPTHHAKAVRAVAGWAVLLTLTLGANTLKAANTHLGSVNEYLSTYPEFPGVYEAPILGIAVKNGRSSLQNGCEFDGVEIVGVIPGGPGAAARLQGERRQVQAIITIGILAASMLFPPAIIGLAALECSGTYESKQFIIAIDGVRTRDVYDFAEALNAVEPGELVYLTLVSNGKRKQLQVELPQWHGGASRLGSRPNG